MSSSSLRAHDKRARALVGTFHNRGSRVCTVGPNILFVHNVSLLRRHCGVPNLHALEYTITAQTPSSPQKLHEICETKPVLHGPHSQAFALPFSPLSLSLSLITSTTRPEESREDAVNGIPDAIPFAKSTFEAFVFHDTCPSHSCRAKRKSWA